MEEAGFKPATWVQEMLDDGNESFFRYDKGAKQYYDIESKSYKNIPGSENIVMLDSYRDTNKVWGNEGATLLDIGDGVLNLEFHTKMNSIGAEVIEGINTAINMAEKDFA